MQSFRLGPLSTNCYLVWDEEKEAVLIDAGGGADKLLAFIEGQGLLLRYLINTHGHYDHIACNLEVAAETGAEILIHEDDAAYLTDIDLNLAGHFAPRFAGRAADRLLKDGETIRCGALSFQVLHTPGHTPGCICLLCGDMLFSGDTLFAGSIGRSDLIGGDGVQLLYSLKEKLWPLSDELKVYPGHNAFTELGKEKQQNSWMRKALELPPRD